MTRYLNQVKMDTIINNGKHAIIKLKTGIHKTVVCHVYDQTKVKLILVHVNDWMEQSIAPSFQSMEAGKLHLARDTIKFNYVKD